MKIALEHRCQGPFIATGFNLVLSIIEPVSWRTCHHAALFEECKDVLDIRWFFGPLGVITWHDLRLRNQGLGEQQENHLLAAGMEACLEILFGGLPNRAVHSVRS